MKKIFTLIAVALATMSVNAQEKYVAIERNAETGAMTLSEEFKAVLPLNEDGSYGDVATNKDERGSVVVMKTASVTVEAVGGSTPADVPDVAGDNTATHVDINADGTVNSWSEIKWQQKNQGDINWAWIQGTGNPAAKIEAEAIMTDDVPATYVDENGVEHTKYRPLYTFYKPDGSLGVPEMGLYYKFTATTAGTIKIGTWVNKGNRRTYVVDAATALPIAYKAEGYINGQNHKILPEGATDSVSVKKYLSSEEIDSIHKAAKVNAETGEDSEPYIIGAGNQPFFGYITFEMEAGKTYYVFCESTQLGFNGWEFTAGAGGGDVIEGEKVMLFFPDGAEAANEITFPGDYKIAITGNPDKTISGGNSITIDGTQYKSMKVSNGAENTLTLPSGLFATKLTFYSYVNKDAQTDRPAFWKEVGGVSYDITTSGGELMSFKDGENPDVRTYTLEKPMNTVTFTNTGEQLCYVLVVNVIDEATGIENVEVVTPVKNNAIYNFSGQKVDASYKGIIIVNGKKFFNK